MARQMQGLQAILNCWTEDYRLAWAAEGEALFLPDWSVIQSVSVG